MIKKTISKILINLIVVILIICIGFGVLYFTRLQTISTLKKITNYEDGYNLYTMKVKYDYSIDKIINSGYTDTRDLLLQ